MISLTRRPQSPSIPLQVLAGTGADGIVDGAVDGTGDGAVEGLTEGDGDVDGSFDGDNDEGVDGTVDGAGDGNVDGTVDGVIAGADDADGTEDGNFDGSTEGNVDGKDEGNADGNVVGMAVTDGRNDGFAESCSVSAFVVDGCRVGLFVSVDGSWLGKDDGERDPSPVVSGPVKELSAVVISLLTLLRSSELVTVTPTLTATTIAMTRTPSIAICKYRFLDDPPFCGSTEVASSLVLILVAISSSG